MRIYEYRISSETTVNKEVGNSDDFFVTISVFIKYVGEILGRIKQWDKTESICVARCLSECQTSSNVSMLRMQV